MEELVERFKVKEEFIKVLIQIDKIDGYTEEESIKSIENFLMQKLMQ